MTEVEVEVELENGNVYTYTYGDKSNTVLIKQLFQTHVITNKNKTELFNKLKEKNVNLNTINNIVELIEYSGKDQYILDQQQNFKNNIISINVNNIKANELRRREIYGAIFNIELNNTSHYNLIPDIDCFTWENVNKSTPLSKIEKIQNLYPYRNSIKTMPSIGKYLFSCENIDTNKISNEVYQIDITNIFEIILDISNTYILYKSITSSSLHLNVTYSCIGDITFLPQITEEQVAPQEPQENENALIPDVSYFYWKPVNQSEESNIIGISRFEGGSRKRRTQKKRKSRRRKSKKNRIK